MGSFRALTRRNFILECCKWKSTLPRKPLCQLKTQRETPSLYNHPQPLCQRFREWRTDARFQNLQLITRLLSSTVDLVQTYQEPVGYSVMFFVDAICQQLVVFHSHPSKISALSKSDTTLYVLLHAKQPKFYCWETFNYGRESHRKHMM